MPEQEPKRKPIVDPPLDYAKLAKDLDAAGLSKKDRHEIVYRVARQNLTDWASSPPDEKGTIPDFLGTGDHPHDTEQRPFDKKEVWQRRYSDQKNERHRYKRNKNKT